MDLLDRYLAAVAALLPKAQREDIVAELRDLLLNRIEEKEEALGRPLTDKEREAVLKDFGHPLAVAGRYGPQQSLIGPTLYPFYVFALKIALAVAAAISVIPAVAAIVLGAGNPARLLANAAFDQFPSSALMLAGLVTLVAAGIERGWVPLTGLTEWKVSDLPVSSKKKGLFETRFNAVFEMVVVALFILWWTGLWKVDLGDLTVKGAVVLKPSAVWQTLFWPILAWSAVQLVLALVTLVQPGRVRLRAAFELAVGAGGMALTTVMWKSLPLFTLEPVTASGADTTRLEQVIGMGFHVAMLVAGITFACQIGAAAWRLYKGAR
ncbi:hypothetical protein DDF62_04345 [Caulobacter radicis]|uniref:HAAS signaling domain-containing protein n=1 Tax=Caulobacter radicis TaxID=2172650 RepID=UPI000D57CF58|nr:hypothetical protein [Caulobacter radicis]PVM92384.1 hypothetical protein DDF62_04345 [Caulobacter radicis]